MVENVDASPSQVRTDLSCSALIRTGSFSNLCFRNSSETMARSAMAFELCVFCYVGGNYKL